jgi:hypothetical protein
MCSVCDFFLINTLLQQQKQKKITFVTKKKINPTQTQRRGGQWFRLASHFRLAHKQDKNYLQMFLESTLEILDLDESDTVNLTLLTDFEKASFAAAQEQFGLSLGGCFFHFKQAVHRHLQELGLQEKKCEHGTHDPQCTSSGARVPGGACGLLA